MSLPARIQAAFALDPSRPLVTWYDDATGERVELSVATTANWVAKTANLLRDSLDVQPGHRVAVALPRHWQTPVVQLAVWLAGASAVPLEPGAALPSDVVTAFASEPDLEGGLVVPRGVEVVALSLQPMAGRLATGRPGVLDFAVEVPGHGDHFALGPPAEGSDLVLDLDLDLVERATALGLGAGDRALVRLQPWTPDGLVAMGLAPLLAGAGVLICSGDDVPQSRLDAERVTLTLS